MFKPAKTFSSQKQGKLRAGKDKMLYNFTKFPCIKQYCIDEEIEKKTVFPLPIFPKLFKSSAVELVKHEKIDWYYD